jgi:SAM-dependent methyltransferase
MTGVPEINVEAIMAQIRESIARRRAAGELARDTVAVTAPSRDHIAAEMATLSASSDIVNVPLASHRKTVGRLVLFVKRMIMQLLTPVLNRQGDYNAGNVRILAGLADQVEALRQDLARVEGEMAGSRAEALHAVHDRLDALDGEQARLRDELTASVHDRVDALHREQAQLRNDVVEPGLEALRERVEALGLEQTRLRSEAVEPGLQALGDRVEALASEQERLHTAVSKLSLLEERLGMLALEQQGTRERVSRAERKLRRILHGVAGEEAQASQAASADGMVGRADPPGDFDYLGFEERYRGSEEEIKERFRVYVDRFKGAAGVLDIGCGRGEFLELLRAARIEAKGVDLDLDMVLLCREKGLDVAKADGPPYLESLPDESLDGVFASQVIEHMETSDIVRLVQLAHRKLRADGILILETPNPRCLTVFAETFYMDLSHTRPIHPAAAKFLLESTGFRNVELQFSAPVDPSVRIPALPAASFPSGAVDEFNRGVERLNELLYGPQDYAVIGEKIAVVSQ